MPVNNLATIRKQIDSIDQQLYQLIKQRAELALQVAAEKEIEGKQAIYYRPEREAEILHRLMERNDSPLADKALTQIFRDIMTACRSLQQILTVAYLGPAGTFSQLAVEQHFGSSVATCPTASITQVFREVEAGNAHYGVVPIENSTEGIVNQTLDALLGSPLFVCGEITLSIHQHLFRNNANEQPIQKIYSHPQSLAQCRNWLEKHYPAAEYIATSSTAQAAAQASQELGTAAIAAEHVDTHGLTLLTKNIEDNPLNVTRFLVIGKQIPAPSGQDKTSLVISSPHKPGSLLTLLQPFAKHDINLTMIESRPYQQHNWHYIFFIDMEGHQQHPEIIATCKQLEQMSVMLRILGSYPKSLS